MNRHAVAASLIVLAALGTSAKADFIDITQPNTTLAQAIGHQFRVGDKIFTLAANAFNSSVFNASQIFISPVTNADPLSGQGFRLSGSFADTPGNGTGSEFVISFTVEIDPAFISQGYRFNDVDLRFNGAATGAGSFSRVDETVMNPNNQLLGNRSVFAIGNGASQLEDHMNFPPANTNLTSLNIVKDVQFFANGDNGTASASFVDQSFSQFITQGIPLPGAAGMGAAGLASALAVVRRRR